MRRLLVLAITLLVVFVAVLIVGELIVEPAVERRIGNEVQSRYGLPARPAVRIDAFPFLVDAVRGELDGAEVAALDVEFEGLAVDRADLDARLIRFDLADLVQGTGEVRAERVDVRVEVTEGALNQYLAERDLAYVITFVSGQITVAGTASLGGRDVSGQAAGTLAIVGSSLQFTPTDVQVVGVPLDEATVAQLRERLAFSVGIPDMVGVRVTGIEIGDGRVVLVAEVADYVLTT